MNQIKRYDPIPARQQDGGYTQMQEAADGEFVRFKDVAKIRAEAIRDATVKTARRFSAGSGDEYCDTTDLMQYADQIEAGHD